MKLIAHRGLIIGPNTTWENHPVQIDKAIENGFDCEIDLRLIGSTLWLGHDYVQNIITYEFLEERKEYLWIHAKNIDVLNWLVSIKSDYRYFWHQNDCFTLTSNGYIWTNPGQPLTYNSICVMPEYIDTQLTFIPKCYGICSDYVQLIKDNLCV